MASAKKKTRNSGPQLPVRSDPFPSWIREYGIDTSNTTFAEFRSGEQLYELLCEHICKNADSSFRLKPKPNVSAATKQLQKLARLAREKKKKSKEKDDTKEEKKSDQTDEKDDDDKVITTLGLGVHKFEFNKETVFALHQTIGQPQAAGWSCRAPTFFESLVLFVKGTKRLKALKDICTYVIEQNESKKDKLFFTIYRFNADQQYWRQSGKKIARDIETIILPEKTLDLITKDIERFLDEKTVSFYFEHGIPYKRSYLFFGVPGSGKSSMIQALAAKYDRNLCFLQATHPKMTDDNFKACIQSAPGNSLIVLEDIDALFNKDRSKKHHNCPLTFSGLLNGLDGVGNPDGQIFILTTNFVDRLDDALIRSGRVDLHLKFPNATDEQLKKMFLLFYPTNLQESDSFVREIRKNFTKGISMAAVQQHFIQNMFAEPKIIIEKVNDLGERLDVEKELNEKSKLKEEKPKENDVLELFKKAFPDVLDNDAYKKLTEQLKTVVKEQTKKDDENEKKEKKDNNDDEKKDDDKESSKSDSFVVVKKDDNTNDKKDIKEDSKKDDKTKKNDDNNDKNKDNDDKKISEKSDDSNKKEDKKDDKKAEKSGDKDGKKDEDKDIESASKKKDDVEDIE